MNVEIGGEAAQFPEKEYINGIAVEVHELPVSIFDAEQYAEPAVQPGDRQSACMGHSSIFLALLQPGT
jgi:hypothetical protein